MDENLSYIDENFIPLGSVAEATKLDPAAVQELLDACVIPRACYFPDEQGNLASNLGNTTTKLDTAWFHPASLAWIRDAVVLLESDVDAGVLAAQRRRWFTKIYTNHLLALRDLGLIETAVWDEAFADERNRAAIADGEFEHWLAGTYGLCTRANTPEAVAVKECMVRNIDQITRKGEVAELDDAKREKVMRYLRLFDHVTALFAPFERAKSSRHRLCVELPQRYGLAIS